MDAKKVGTLVDDVNQGRISRRDFLRAAIGLGLSVPAATGLLQACAPAPGATPTTALGQTPVPTTAPTKTPTVAPTKTSAIIGLTAVPQNLDPFLQGSIAEKPLQVNIFDSLFDLDEQTMELKPVVVEDWEQLDDLTWVFKLKEGVQFHKGWGEMTAEDWAWWVNKIITEKGIGYMLLGSGLVEEAVVVDRYTIEVHLSGPWGPFPVTSLVRVGGFVLSREAYDEMGPEEFALNPIGTGPFELESWTPGGEVVLKKFEDYHDPDLPRLEELIWQPVEDRVVRLEKIREGELDWTFDLDMKDIPELRQDPNLQVLEAGGWNWDYITFNLTLADRPWQDKRVRQAIAYAVDREAIVQSIYHGAAVAEDDSLPSGYLGADPDPQFYPNTADLETARALLAEAGYADGFAMPCLTSGKPNLRQELQVVADQLGQIGIAVEIEQTDMAAYRTRFLNLQFETILEDAGLASPDSDSALYWWYHTTSEEGTNRGADGYSDTEVDELLEQARVSTDREERVELYRQAVELIAEDCPKVIICNVNKQFVLNAGLAGFQPTPIIFFPYFKTMYWST